MNELLTCRRAVTIVPLVALLTGIMIERAIAQAPPAVVTAAPRVVWAEPRDAPPVRPLAEIDVAPPTISGDVPADLSANLFSPPSADRRSDEPVTFFTWAPTNLHHQPLYFDDAALERYGQRVHPPAQPLVSAAHFYGTFAVMPIKLLIEPPHQKISTQGQHRPDSPAPCCR